MEQSIITRIEKLNGYSKQYRIFVDGEERFSVHEDVLVKYQLHKGLAIDPEQIQEILTSEAYHQVKRAVLHYISYRPRTVWEVRRHIAGKELNEEQLERVIAELEDLHYLDDQAYAKAWVAERQGKKGLGVNRLRQELQRKGIAPQWIDEALSHRDEEEERQLAMEIAERRYLRLCHEPWQKVERKLGQYLLRQGYASDQIYAILRVFRSRHAGQ